MQQYDCCVPKYMYCIHVYVHMRSQKCPKRECGIIQICTYSLAVMLLAMELLPSSQFSIELILTIFVGKIKPHTGNVPHWHIPTEVCNLEHAVYVNWKAQGLLPGYVLPLAALNWKVAGHDFGPLNIPTFHQIRMYRTWIIFPVSFKVNALHCFFVRSCFSLKYLNRFFFFYSLVTGIALTSPDLFFDWWGHSGL